MAMHASSMGVTAGCPSVSDLLLTVWLSADHRDLGDALFAVSTADELDPALQVTRLWSLTAQAVSARVRWTLDGVEPAQLDMRRSVAQLTRDGVILVDGRVSSYRWGDQWQSLDLTIQGGQVIDSGDWYGPGAEISAARFPDVAAATDARSRAYRSSGLLPPRVWCPPGSSLAVPALVVQDEVKTNSATALAPRRHLLSYDPPVGPDEWLHIRDPDRDERWLAATSAETTATVATDTDGVGEIYYYLPGGFVLPFGSASVDLTNASDVAQAYRTTGRCRVGWQIRGSGAGSGDWVPTTSVDGRDLELAWPYRGATVTSGEGETIPLPADRADSAFWMVGYHGTARHHVVDVLSDWLRLARLSLPVAYGDLQALRARLPFSSSYVRRERGSPWAKVQQALDLLPIRPWVRDGVIRFAWRGVPDDADVVATLDTTALCGVYRADPWSWADAEPSPSVELSHAWDIPTQRFLGVVSPAGGRALQAEADTDAGVPLRVQADWLEVAPGPQLAALWVLYRVGLQPQRMTLEVDASWLWLEPGSVLRVDGALWWVEAVTVGVDRGQILLESAAE